MSWRTMVPKEWDYDITLYLATMKRMVSRLATMTSFCDNCSVAPDDLEWKMSISRHNKLPLTLFPNNNYDPAATTAAEAAEVFPVVEWVVPADEGETLKSSRRIGKILIRIQGSSSSMLPDSSSSSVAPQQQSGGEYTTTCLKQSHNVSLIFEASFDVNDEDLQAEGQ